MPRYSVRVILANAVDYDIEAKNPTEAYHIAEKIACSMDCNPDDWVVEVDNIDIYGKDGKIHRINPNYYPIEDEDFYDDDEEYYYAKERNYVS